ncbi:MAG TPA: hypothetical protein VFT87_01085 [Candidatus Saccharimonadales bacterium]|nr:hypothetical protein [Candidatus Saccharimonadales bacterium]
MEIKTKTKWVRFTQWLESAWVVLARIAQVVAAVNLYQCDQVQAFNCSVPLVQLLAAVMLADVVYFVYKLTAQNSK